MLPGKVGRRPADRRVPVRPPGLPVFPYRRRRRHRRQVPPRSSRQAPSAGRSRALAGWPSAARSRTPRSRASGSRRSRPCAVFSSDNLSSVAYATEAILFTLLAAGTGAFGLTVPISALIVAVLGIIVVSYRQTIRAYPNGGGSYVVARENLGTGRRLGRGRRAAHRLRPDGVCQRRRGRGCDHLGVPRAARRRPRRARGGEHPDRHADQPPRRPRERHDLRDPDLPIRGLDARAHRASASSARWPAPPPSSPTSSRRRCPRRRFGRPAPDARVRRRMHGDHRRRGRLERGPGVQAVRVVERTRDADGDGRARRRSCSSARAGWPRSPARCPAERETVLSQLGRAVFGGVGPAVPRAPALDDGHPHPRREHGVRRLPAAVLAPGPRRLHAAVGSRSAASASPSAPGSWRSPSLSIAVLAAFGGRVEALIPLYAVGVFTSITLVAGRHGPPLVARVASRAGAGA